MLRIHDEQLTVFEVVVLTHLAFHTNLCTVSGSLHEDTISKVVVSLHNELASRLGNLHALIAKRFTALLVTLAGINELHLALTFCRFVASDDPDISGNACVVEEVVGQLHDGLQPVVLQEVTTNVAFTTAGIALEQRRAVLYDSHTACVLQLCHTIEQE